MNWLYRIKIRYQLLLVVLVAVFPALMIILFSSYERRAHALEDARVDCANYAVQLAGRIGTLSESCRVMLEALAHSADVRARVPEKCSAVLADIVRNNPQFYSFTAALPDGTLFAAASSMSKPVSVTDRKFFREAVRTGSFSAGEYVISRTANRPIIGLAYPVYDDRGVLSSVLHVGVAVSYLDELARTIPMPAGASFTVTDWKGVVLVHTGARGPSAGEQDDPTLFEKTRTCTGPGGFRAETSGRTMAYACSSLRLPNSVEPYVYVRAEIPEQVVVAPIARIMRWYLTMFLVAAGLALAVAWFIGNRVLGNRIAKVAAFANQVGAMRGGTVPAPDVSGGELGDLAKALDDMSTSLARTIGALKESEERFRSLVETTSDWVWELDAQGRYTYVSPKVEEILGYAPEEVLRRTPFDFMPTAEAERVRALVVDLMSRGAPISAVQNRNRHRDGREVVLETSGVPIRDASGTVVGYRGIDRDITERLRAEELHVKVERQMLESQKLESLGVLAGGIAHDFNNLLVGILGNIDLALEDLPASSPARDTLQDAEKAARRSADLCRQMLAYSGKGRFVMQALDLAELIAETSQILQVSIPKKAVLRFDCPKGIPAIEGDATQIRQVVMNLIINASEAIGDKEGVITVSIRAMDCDREHLVGAYSGEGLTEGQYVCLEVTDTGCGMDEATKARIFDPFFTTKFRGRGLGLAAVLGIVRGHKGAIRVYSEPGKGTTFRTLLPAIGRAPEPPSETEGHAGWTGTGTVLLADDEEAVRTVGKRMLERLGFRVILAADGAEAVALFRQVEAKGNGRIVCVILDLMMPRMDGEQAFIELRQIRRDVEVILSSGYNEQEVSQRFTGQGLAGFIQKPYLQKELAARLRATLHRAHSEGAPSTS